MFILEDNMHMTFQVIFFQARFPILLNISSSGTTIILIMQPNILASPPLTPFFIFFPPNSVHIPIKSSFENIHYYYYSGPNPLYFTYYFYYYLVTGCLVSNKTKAKANGTSWLKVEN